MNPYDIHFYSELEWIVKSLHSHFYQNNYKMNKFTKNEKKSKIDFEEFEIIEM